MVVAEYEALKPLMSIEKLVAKEINGYFYIYPVTRVSVLNTVWAILR